MDSTLCCRTRAASAVDLPGRDPHCRGCMSEHIIAWAERREATTVSREVHRPRGSFDIDSSFWDLSYKVRTALFFLSFNSRSYARTTHPLSPVGPENTHSSSLSYMLHATGWPILFTVRELSPWLGSATTATLFLWFGG